VTVAAIAAASLFVSIRTCQRADYAVRVTSAEHPLLVAYVIETELIYADAKELHVRYGSTWLWDLKLAFPLEFTLLNGSNVAFTLLSLECEIVRNDEGCACTTTLVDKERAASISFSEAMPESADLPVLLGSTLTGADGTTITNPLPAFMQPGDRISFVTQVEGGTPAVAVTPRNFSPLREVLREDPQEVLA